MKYRTVWNAHFSPSGTTKTIVKRIAAGFSAPGEDLDMLSQADFAERHLAADDLLIVGVPVFSGRIPTPCIAMLKRLTGARTPAIPVVVYGNRDYDDALLELIDLLEGQGFITLGAAAFIAQHSIFPALAAGRPDANDLAKIDQFSRACAQALDAAEVMPKGPMPVKGHFPYRKISNIPFKPIAQGECTACGTCARVCPLGAIDPEHPQRTNKDLCVSCTACIAACPQQARRFQGLVYRVAGKVFLKKYAARKEPDVFVP